MQPDNYLPCRSRDAQCVHSGLPPVPARRFSRSMLLPSVHLLLSWCTDCLTECQGESFMVS
jgi:hypothetical protein